jgi:DNA-binding winged helix-turn-helix (wHTH) protein
MEKQYFMIQFGEFILDSKQARLSYQGKEVAIEPKLFELLLLFVQQPNSIISRQGILDNLWTGSLVTDNAINKLVANLRKILADDPKNPRYIQTVPKRGYRLVCKVTLLETLKVSENNPPTNKSFTEENKSLNAVKYKTTGAAIIVLLLILFSLFLWQALTNNNKNGIDNRYTVELTRAHGAEQSARMHPDSNHLYYLKSTPDNDRYQLWIKNINTAKIKQVDLGRSNISKIISVVAGEKNGTTNLLYLDKKQDSCGVYQAVLIQPSSSKKTKQTIKAIQWQQTEKLFDCSDKRIKDIDYHASKNMIYYTAQPQNYWPNQIYAFDLATKKQSFVAQAEPVGWGHHSIDISPDGNKLLIMSTNGDYKTQLLVLNLINNEVTEGFKFDYLVTEAIWHHDSEQVYFYAAPPAHQIIKSDLNGDHAIAVVSVSEYLSPQMSLFPDGQNLLFSTEQKNFSNRWLAAPKQAASIDNSTVYDITPALFHHRAQYLFISKRSGRRQLYLGHYDTKQAEIVTNFSQDHWLGYMAMSANDQSILLSAENEVYLIPISYLNGIDPLTTLKQEHLIFTSEQPIISLDWLTKKSVAITTVNNGIPELKTVDLVNNKVQQLKGKWAYGLTDSQHPEYTYLIEQQTNALYRANSLTLNDNLAIDQYQLTKTHITLPKGFYHVKIDANLLYYGSDENDSEYINVVPLNNTGEVSKHHLNNFYSYDVSNGKIMLSDIESLEGDVHRTMH